MGSEKLGDLCSLNLRNSWECIDEMLGEYQATKLPLFNMNFGAPDAEPSEKSALDGHSGVTHLGAEPVLYTHTAWYPGANFRPGWGPGFSPLGFTSRGNNVPEFGIRREALDWKKLLSITRQTRYTEIIKRVNLLSYLYGLILIDPIEWMRCIEDAKKNHRYSTIRNKEFPTPKLE